MTESSRSRVTISIGRGRQVVRRAGVGLDASDEQSTSLIGTKRSSRDRLGGDAGSSVSRNGPMNNKRQRGDISFSNRGSNGVSDMHIGRDDLRLKLMRKNASRQSSTDLREKLDKTAHSSAKVLDTQRHLPDRKEGTYMTRIPPSSVINELPRVDHLGTSSYAYRSMDFGHIRQRSPERMASMVRGLSPPRSREDMQRLSAMRSLDDARSVSYMRKATLEPPRPAGTNSVYMRNLPHPTTNSRPLQSVLGQLPPPQAAAVQRSPFMVYEHQTVDGLLQALGLGKYAILLKAEEANKALSELVTTLAPKLSKLLEENGLNYMAFRSRPIKPFGLDGVDMTALKQMGESDLKEIGIPMGPRKKILLALAPSSKRQQ